MKSNSFEKNPNPMVRQLGYGPEGKKCDSCIYFWKICTKRRSRGQHPTNFDACGDYKERK